MKNPWRICALGKICLALTLAGCAAATSRSDPDVVPVAAFMPAGQRVLPPYGFIGFCLRNGKDCEGGSDRPLDPPLTPALWSELNAVNDYVNRLPQISDEENYGRREVWTYPNERGGDCEDFALLKRRLLVERGWPADALLLAAAETWNGEGHAVLLVETDRGEFVLDNRNWAILPPRDTAYRWKKRQSRERPYIWVALDPADFRPDGNALPPLGETPSFVAAARKRVERDAATGSIAR